MDPDPTIIDVEQPLPDHVEDVRKGLLDFHNFIGVGAAEILENDDFSNDELDRIPLSAYKDDAAKASQRARDVEFLEAARKLTKGARALQTKSPKHRDWEDLFKNGFKDRTDDVCGFCPGEAGPIVLSVCKTLEPDSIESPDSDPSLGHEIYFGFRRYNDETLSSVRFGAEAVSSAFTTSTLKRFEEKGLRTLPDLCDLTNTDDASGEASSDDDQNHQLEEVCFPWCVIYPRCSRKTTSTSGEKEKEKEISLVLLANASNAASEALEIYETLARFAEVKEKGQHVPPVVTITSEGAHTTVWLAYFEAVDGQMRDHLIQAIWRGNISEIWHAVQFCRIIDNLLYWVQHILRPKVAFYVDQWSRHFPTAPNLHSQLAEDTETAHLVYRIQDRLSALGISTATNIPALIEQTVIFQEMMRPSTIRTEKAPAQETEITPGTAGMSIRNTSPPQNEHSTATPTNPKIPEAQEDDGNTENLEHTKGHESIKGKNTMVDNDLSKGDIDKRLRLLGVTWGDDIIEPSSSGPDTNTHTHPSETTSISDERQKSESQFSFPHQFKPTEFVFTEHGRLSSINKATTNDTRTGPPQTSKVAESLPPNNQSGPSSSRRPAIRIPWKEGKFILVRLPAVDNRR